MQKLLSCLCISKPTLISFGPLVVSKSWRHSHPWFPFSALLLLHDCSSCNSTSKNRTLAAKFTWPLQNWSTCCMCTEQLPGWSTCRRQWCDLEAQVLNRSSQSAPRRRNCAASSFITATINTVESERDCTMWYHTSSVDCYWKSKLIQKMKGHRSRTTRNGNM